MKGVVGLYVAMTESDPNHVQMGSWFGVGDGVAKTLLPDWANPTSVKLKNTDKKTTNLLIITSYEFRK